jgi:hypothetical protein
MKIHFTRTIMIGLVLVSSWVFLGASCRPAIENASKIDATQGPDVVTYANLYERESDWPYRIQLTQDWKPEGWVGRFGFGVGILVRVEPSGDLRVDFGHLGKFLVPARETNVLAEANKIGSGEVEKTRANFVVAVGTRLLDPALDPPRPVEKMRTEDARAFLLVFADPGSANFRSIATSVSPVLESEGVLVVLVPQGGRRDGSVLNACRAAGWTAPFLFDRFVLPLTESLLEEPPQTPHVMLVTPEGRLLYSAAWADPSEREGWMAAVTSAVNE